MHKMWQNNVAQVHKYWKHTRTYTNVINSLQVDTLLSILIHSLFSPKRDPWAYFIFTPNSIQFIMNSWQLTIASNTKDKFYWERPLHFLELLPTVTGWMLFLWDSVKTKMIIKSQDCCNVILQIVSE